MTRAGRYALLIRQVLVKMSHALPPTENKETALLLLQIACSSRAKSRASLAAEDGWIAERDVVSQSMHKMPVQRASSSTMDAADNINSENNQGAVL